MHCCVHWILSSLMGCSNLFLSPVYLYLTISMSLAYPEKPPASWGTCCLGCCSGTIRTEWTLVSPTAFCYFQHCFICTNRTVYKQPFWWNVSSFKLIFQWKGTQPSAHCTVLALISSGIRLCEGFGWFSQSLSLVFSTSLCTKHDRNSQWLPQQWVVGWCS